MKHEPVYHRLLELSWRRKLTAEEERELQTWLAAHPEALADWEAEAGLNEALRQLPEAPVPSNFTARVLQAVDREKAAQGRQRASRWPAWATPSGWLRRVAYASLLVALGGVSYRVGEVARTTQLAASVETVARVSPAVNPEILEDFDAIRALPSSPAPDVELLALLK